VTTFVQAVNIQLFLSELLRSLQAGYGSYWKILEVLLVEVPCFERTFERCTDKRP
jgi:hypothetical protein